jgi:hypothetical protein
MRRSLNDKYVNLELLTCPFVEKVPDTYKQNRSCVIVENIKVSDRIQQQSSARIPKVLFISEVSHSE